MSIQFTLDYDGGAEYPLKITGNHTFTHGSLKSDWTRKQLACDRNAPAPQSYLLRSLNLCGGRARLEGALVTDEMTVTTTYGNDPSTTTLEPLCIWTYNAGLEAWECKSLNKLLPIGLAYPDWSNDPYSVARRNQIDQIIAGGEKTIYFDIGNDGAISTEPPDAPGFTWPKSGDNDTFTGGGWSKSCTISYTFTVT
jgi:hypothetical protein